MTITVNGEPRQVDDHATVAMLLRELNLAPRRVAVEVNLELVPREQQDQFALREGDALEVVTLVGGG
ncbi:MAG: sulfur carrier protein ThiS [Pirellulaceae bacterium]